MPKFHTPTFPVDPHLTATSQEGVPAPGTLTYAASKEGKCGSSPKLKRKADPTRYGDWERNGRCIDF